MRAILVVGLFILLCPAMANAQGAPAPSDSPGSSPAAASPPRAEPRARGGPDISRADYIERAKRNAEKRFDRMDTNRDGILTIEERRAARGKRRHKSEPE